MSEPERVAPPGGRYCLCKPAEWIKAGRSCERCGFESRPKAEGPEPAPDNTRTRPERTGHTRDG